MAVELAARRATVRGHAWQPAQARKQHGAISEDGQ